MQRRAGPKGGTPHQQLPRTHVPPSPRGAAASVILTYFVCSDGCTNWLLGLQLVATYCLIAFIFCLEKEPPSPPLPPVPSPPPMPRAGW